MAARCRRSGSSRPEPGSWRSGATTIPRPSPGPARTAPTPAWPGRASSATPARCSAPISLGRNPAPPPAVETTVTSLLARLERAAETDAVITFVGSAAGNGRLERVPIARLHDDARALAATLQARG